MQKILTTHPPSYELSQGMTQPGLGDHPPSNNDQFQNVGHIANTPVYVQNQGYTTQNHEYPAQNPGYPVQNAGYPVQNAAYPVQNAAYPVQNAAYPVQNAGYPQRKPVFTTPEISSRAFVNLTVNPVPIVIGPMGPHPSTMVCPRCSAMVTTEARISPNILAWISCASLAFFGFIFGCCLIPFCLRPCQNVEHYCPECKVYLGRYAGTDIFR